MGSVFGGGDNGAAKLAKRQAAEARRNQQTANEDTARATQRAERGAASTSGRGRDMLIGNLSSMLSDKLGG